MKKFVIVFIFLICLTGCVYEDIYVNTLKDEYKNNQSEKFTLSDDYGYSDDYGFAYYIEGLVTNNTNKSYSYVQIEFNAYDSDGNLLGSCWDNINNLEPNGTWKIKAMCSGEAKEIASYKFVEFTSW